MPTWSCSSGRKSTRLLNLGFVDEITLVPGFRCLGPFLVETCALVEAGVGLEQLDKVMKSYGLPVGPITLADEVNTRLQAGDKNLRVGGVGVFRDSASTCVLSLSLWTWWWWMVVLMTVLLSLVRAVGAVGVAVTSAGVTGVN